MRHNISRAIESVKDTCKADLDENTRNENLKNDFVYYAEDIIIEIVNLRRDDKATQQYIDGRIEKLAKESGVNEKYLFELFK